MKKFAFPLDRVADWRRAQARLEEIKLERLHAERCAIDARENTLHQELAASEKAVLASPVAAGLELAALDAFRRYAGVEQRRIVRSRADCGKRIAAQLEVVTAKRRDIRLLERLKERRLETWRVELGREMGREADERYLAKWNARV